jgi:hypothetical protein
MIQEHKDWVAEVKRDLEWEKEDITNGLFMYKYFTTFKCYNVKQCSKMCIKCHNWYYLWNNKTFFERKIKAGKQLQLF